MLVGIVSTLYKDKRIMRDTKTACYMSTKKAPMRPKKDKKMLSRPGKDNFRSEKGERKSGAPHKAERIHRNHKTADSLSPPRDCYFLWGHHALQGALRNPARRIKALYCTSQAQDKLISLIQEQSAERKSALPEAKIVERAVLDQIDAEGGKAVHQGLVAAVMPLASPSLDEYLEGLDEQKPQRVMVLDQLSDPRNIGAILRSARAFGTSALILQDRHAPEETGSLARTAVGALEEVTLIKVVNLARALDQLKHHFFYVAGLDMDGSNDIKRAASADRLALVMGSEGKGMRRLIHEACDEILAIEMADTSESLNVSVAAAIMMHGTQSRS